MLTFHFSEKRSFHYENDDEKSKTKRWFLKTIVFFKSSFLKMVFLNDRFSKRSFLQTIVFQNNSFYKIRRFVNDR